MKAISYSEWPKFPRRPDITMVGRFDGTIEQFAAMLNAESKEFFQKASREGPEHRYRTIFFRLDTGAYGALTEHAPGTMELSLPVVRDEFVFDEDYDEALFVLGLNPDHVDKFEGNFTWLPDRKAKRVKPPDEPLPEDWWNQVQVSPSKRPSQRKKHA